MLCMEPYLVPFTFDRSNAPHYRLRNIGPEPVRGVTATLIGGGLMPLGPPRALQPDEQLVMTVRGDDLARTTVLIVRWLRSNGEEYLWRVAF